MIITVPIHKLGKLEKAVLSELLYYRYKFSLEVSNESIIQKMLFDYDTKLQIAENLGINQGRYAMIITSLRKSGVIKKRTLQKHYIPDFKGGDTEYTFAYRFKIKESERKKKNNKKNDALGKR